MRRFTPTWVAFAVFAAALGALSLARYFTFHSRSLDMAYYVRLVWGIAHGHWDNPVVGAPNLFGLHLEPVLLPFAALARLGLPIAETLLVVQALATAAAIFPAARLARRHLAPGVGEGWAFAAALTILLLPTVSRCVDHDFHPSTMAVWPLLAFVDALDEGRGRAAWAWFFAALACREDVGLQGAAAALTLVAWPRRPGERRRGALLAAAGVAWFAIYAFAIQPRFLEGNRSYDAHFGPLGGGAGGVPGVLRAVLADPAGLLRHLASEDRPAYPLVLLAQVALMPLLAPRWVAGALPIVAINLLSAFPRVRTVQAHYVTAAAPFLAAAAICGAGRLAAALPRWRALAPGALAAAAAVAYLLRGASPLSPEWRWASYRKDERARRAAALVAAIPRDASVAAPHELLAHLAERRDAYLVDLDPPKVEWRIERDLTVTRR